MRNGAKTEFARQWRKTMTNAETRLWFHLRRRQLYGFRFRRQHPLGIYVVDFICVEAQLIVEVDGSQHLESMLDAARDRWLRDNRFQILRFWNDDVLVRTNEVLAEIVTVLNSAGPHPPSAPPPLRRGREGEFPDV